MREDQNNFSYWYPKIKDCGAHVPESVIIPVPDEIVECFFMERKTDEDTVYQFVKEQVLPRIPKEFAPLVFVKNGTFSNKYDFRSCVTHPDALDIARSIIDINYMALLYGADGCTELVFRKHVRDDGKHYEIYGGMPLQPEFRVFYDFDRRKVLYTANYWDWDYCHDTIAHQSMTDGLVYEKAYEEIEKFYETQKDDVARIAGDVLKDVKLDGKWSVDFMYADGKYWLIDMATAEKSAYWEPGREDR